MGLYSLSGLVENGGLINQAGLNFLKESSASFDPLSLDPYLLFDTQTSMLGELESLTLDLNPAIPSSLDVITATRSGVATYTDVNGVIQTAPADTVRVDHVDGVPMMLIEPSATNLVDYSNLDKAGVWSGSGFSVTQNAIASPDGLNNGTKMEQTSTIRNFSGNFIPSSTGTSVTYSFWVKKGSGATHLNKFTIRNNSQSPFNQTGSINLDTGEIIQNDFGADNLIVEPYPNGWFKVKATRDTNISVGDSINIYPPYISSSGENEAGQYVYTFGHQVEYGTLATSFIPTSGSAVTRNADNLVIDGTAFTDFFNDSEGTFYVEGVMNKGFDGGQNYILGSQSSSARFLYQASSSHAFRVYDGATTSTTSYGASGEIFRAAVTYDATNKSLSVNGVTNDSSHNGNLGSIPTALYIGSQNFFAHANTSLKRIIYWPVHSSRM